MLQRFRLFIQKHENGTYTVTVPGIARIDVPDVWLDSMPATSTLSAHGLLVEEVKDDIRTALEKWLGRADPADLHRYTNYRDGQYLEKVEIELRPQDRHGQKRKDKVRLTVSLMLERQENEQYLVSVPRLIDPALSFFCYSLAELREDAARELTAHFKGESLESLLRYEQSRQEYLDDLEVRFTPLKPQREKKPKDDEEDPSFWALKTCAANLTARARENKLSRAYRRDAEVKEVLEALASDRGSLVLVGRPGCGKTAIVHEVVRRIREEQCDPSLRKRQVWYTSPSQLIAGCMYLGQWQEKLRNVVDEIKKRRHILHVEDMADLLDTGKSSANDNNMADFLKPFLADGTVVIVGEMTPERYRAVETENPGFLGQFRTLKVEETDEDTTLSILGSVGGTLEHALKVRIEPGAAEIALQLTRRFQPYRAFPGKAVQFLHQAAADASRGAGSERPVVSRQFAVDAFARYTGLPEFILSDHLTLDPGAVERHFEERLIGQLDAVRTVVDLITVIKAGLNDPNKPLGCFFFVGPTGVGKTELVKALAEYLFGGRDRVLRFDMSEYSDPLTVSRLIGSAHGSGEGELTRGIRLQPFSVVLLDEFEKADPSVYDVMLQVLGEGRLTDATGRTSDFRSAIVIMTSNLGASPREQRRPGLVTGDAGERSERHYGGQVESYFRPEFVNRLDAVVAFRSLDREAMRRIATREISFLLQREGVKRRGILVEVEDEVLDLLVETGFSPQYGARPLKREIERRVVTPLARYLVAHRLGEAQLIRIRREEGEIRLSSTSLSAPNERVRRPGSGLTPGADGGSQKVELKDVIEGLAGLRLRLQEWSDRDTVQEIRNEWKRLLASTRRRDFQNHGPKAHEIWTRIYHLERIVKRVDQLRERAEYLEEFAALSQRERYRDYLPELGRSFTELRRDLAYLEVELLSAHLPQNNHALVRLTQVGRSALPAGATPWLQTLARMYLRWAKRKGYGTRALVPTPLYASWLKSQELSPKSAILGYDPGPPVVPPWAELPGTEPAAILERVQELNPPALILAVKGANVFGFLRGEEGTHKLLLRDDADPSTPFQTVVAEASSLPVDAIPGEHLLAEFLEANRQKEEEERLRKLEGKNAPPRKAAAPPEIPPVIRLYQPDGDRYVRDVRTEHRTTLVRDVLDGDLDDFILAYLSTEEAAKAWG